jgi:hypothetical protein
VEYSQGILVNNIVQDLNVMSVPVKTNKQMPGIKVILSVTVIKPLIVQDVIKSPTNVGFGNAMLEC